MKENLQTLSSAHGKSEGYREIGYTAEPSIANLFHNVAEQRR